MAELDSQLPGLTAGSDAMLLRNLLRKKREEAANLNSSTRRCSLQ